MTQADLGLLKESSFLKTTQVLNDSLSEKAQKAGNFSPVAFSGTLGLKLTVFLNLIYCH